MATPMDSGTSSSTGAFEQEHLAASEEAYNMRSSGSLSVDLRRLTFHGGEAESGTESGAIVDREYGKFHRRLTQVGMTQLSRFSELDPDCETRDHETMNFQEMARRAVLSLEVEKDSEQQDVDDCNARPGPDLAPPLKLGSRRIKTIGAGLHQYSFATGRFVAENLNLTSLRLSFQEDESKLRASTQSESIASMRSILDLLDQEQHPMYSALRTLMSSISRSESCPLVVEVSRVEHPYESLSEGRCFLALVSRKGKRYESALFVMNVPADEDEELSLRFAIPLEADMSAETPGDGTLVLTSPVSGDIFRFHMPSLQSMWSAVNALQNYIKIANKMKVHPSLGKSHEWLEFYEPFLEAQIATSSASSHKQPAQEQVTSTVGLSKPGRQPFLTELSDEERDATIIRAMREVFQKFREDLDRITFKMMYAELGEVFGMDMKQSYKPFIDEKLVMVLGQMESASEVIDSFLYLGTEWNASNREELEERNCAYVLNMTSEIEVYFPDHFTYMRCRILDQPEENILEHLDGATDFIAEARNNGSAILVHCQMGVSRSASAVIAYMMKTYGVSLDEAYRYVKGRRDVIQPNPGFWKQLQAYEQTLVKRWKEADADFPCAPTGLRIASC